jgi:hypothetical protein
MACDISLGRLEPCKDSVGGLKAVYFINYDSSYYVDKVVDTDDVVEDLGSAFNLYKYDLRGANNFDETNEQSKENGTSFWSAAGTVALKKQDAVTRKELKLLSYGRPIIVTEGYDGIYKCYGLENGCDVQVGTASGSAMGDFNGYNLTIAAQEKEPAYILNWATFIGVGNGTIVEGV